ncbi:50S ribosomal protein L19 [Candidatus Phycorickettsia trachydisci]|uniref:Large ribosomal subunit protein bL19 n=1 Tax=Candidatus Phycorickettsia trachydisci TaxID=2115978 RepID=A0A2P1P6Y9_9RICK|nr:50S ribosomal protein L19 [Candidatus Phycorickettsia trachydisci]AVP87031.1 50S ribosomal protein L19 [Candidatus Phycorickettsia trachydisci]
MHPTVVQLQEREIQKLSENKKVPEFKAGDTLKVSIKIQEGTTERIQAFQGIVISKRNRGLTSCFKLFKISHGEGVERTFMQYAPNVVGIEVISQGIVRRAKLYYLKSLKGKAARIKTKAF